VIADEICINHLGGFKAAAEAAEPACPTCEGGGWQGYGIGHGDPHFRECPTCGNPEGHPSP
jgi:hypothetical protein